MIESLIQLVSSFAIGWFNHLIFGPFNSNLMILEKINPFCSAVLNKKAPIQPKESPRQWGEYKI
jgi:hypothetical protein